MLVIGIDPGASGGICFLDPVMGQREACKLPNTDTDIIDLLRRGLHGRQTNTCHAIIERQTPRPTFFKGKSSVLPSTCKLFGNYRFLEGVLLSFGVPHTRVLPKEWQSQLGCHRLKSHTDSQWKNRLKDQAVRFYGNSCKITLATADACLLAWYGQLKVVGTHSVSRLIPKNYFQK